MTAYRAAIPISETIHGNGMMKLLVMQRLLLLLGLLVGLSFSVNAQISVSPVKGPTDTTAKTSSLTDTPEAIREMVSRLSDTEVRSLLLQHLDRQAGPSLDQENNLLNFIQTSAIDVAESVADAFKLTPLLWQKQKEGFSRFFKGRELSGVGYLIGCMLLAIVIGLMAEWVINRLAIRWREQISQTQKHSTLRQTLRLLGLRLLLNLIGLLAFFITTHLVLSYVMLEADRPFVELIMLNLVFLPRLAAAFVQFFLAPKRPDLRLVHTDNQSARYLHRHLVGLVVFMGLTAFIILFNSLNDIPLEETRVGFWTNILVHIYVGVIAWRARKGLVMIMLGQDRDVSPFEARIARGYPGYVITVTVVIWLLVEIIAGMGRFDLLVGGASYLTLGLLTWAPAMDTLVRGLVKHLVPPMTGEGELAQRAYQSTKRSYIRIGRVLVFALTVFWITSIWNIEFENLASAEFGARAAARLIEIMFIFAIGYLVWELTTLWLNRKLAAEQTTSGIDSNEEGLSGEGGGAGSSRLSTVLPLIRWVLQTLIISMTLLIGLGNIGIDITPLLAGAGVVGLAIGFGAQKLVTDVVSGIFFLIDDAFRAGEYLDIESTLGTVEKISLRSIQLRHHRGPVHTIPYGEIPKITNYSRDWVIMKLRFTVPFDTDLTKVKKLFKQIGNEMMEIPKFAQDFLQPFKSQGVQEVDDVGIVVRGKFMTKPGKQFVLRKEIYQRVQKAFGANNIQFARKEVRVRVESEPGELESEHTQQAIAGGAAESVQEARR